MSSLQGFQQRPETHQKTGKRTIQVLTQSRIEFYPPWDLIKMDDKPFIGICALVFVGIFILGLMNWPHEEITMDYTKMPQQYQETVEPDNPAVCYTCLEGLPQNPDIAVHQGYYFRNSTGKYCRELPWEVCKHG